MKNSNTVTVYTIKLLKFENERFGTLRATSGDGIPYFSVNDLMKIPVFDGVDFNSVKLYCLFTEEDGVFDLPTVVNFNEIEELLEGKPGKAAFIKWLRNEVIPEIFRLTDGEKGIANTYEVSRNIKRVSELEHVLRRMINKEG